jgi:hypothetical protein
MVSWTAFTAVPFVKIRRFPSREKYAKSAIFMTPYTLTIGIPFPEKNTKKVQSSYRAPIQAPEPVRFSLFHLAWYADFSGFALRCQLTRPPVINPLFDFRNPEPDNFSNFVVRHFTLKHPPPHRLFGKLQIFRQPLDSQISFHTSPPKKIFSGRNPATIHPNTTKPPPRLLKINVPDPESTQ